MRSVMASTNVVAISAAVLIGSAGCGSSKPTYSTAEVLRALRRYHLTIDSSYDSRRKSTVLPGGLLTFPKTFLSGLRHAGVLAIINVGPTGGSEVIVTTSVAHAEALNHSKRATLPIYRRGTHHIVGHIYRAANVDVLADTRYEQRLRAVIADLEASG
jgi:hypothetical protein